MQYIAIALFVLGAIICCLNFYFSFLHYPVHLMMGRSKEDYRWNSGFPIFGSLFVAISLFKLWQPTWCLVLAIVLILIDTGGLHWFAGVMFWREFLNRGDVPTTNSTVHYDGEPPDED